MDKRIEELCSLYSFDKGKISGYRGGYPIVEFMLNDTHKNYKPERKKIEKIVRRAEMGAGMELGVGLNFRKTAFVIWEEERIVICGHILVIERVLNDIFL